LKVLLKAPTPVYRARLGFLLGNRFLMIEHRGRQSGTLHRTVVEVAVHRRQEWICASGTGNGADWYRNLRANGLEAVWIGSRRHNASVQFLASEDAAGVMHEYEQAHPRTAARLFKIMGVSYDGTDEGRVRMMEAIPMVAFTLIE
jgi:deazaflavin-dependent oxidoreductase (nitroreductase family)